MISKKAPAFLGTLPGEGGGGRGKGGAGVDTPVPG